MMVQADKHWRSILERLYSPRELADYLGIPLQTVYRWRSNGRGPRGVRVGRHVRYAERDVQAWLDSRSTSVR
jgi:excisionase family DNA binding protein